MEHRREDAGLRQTLLQVVERVAIKGEQHYLSTWMVTPVVLQTAYQGGKLGVRCPQRLKVPHVAGDAHQYAQQFTRIGLLGPRRHRGYSPCIVRSDSVAIQLIDGLLSAIIGCTAQPLRPAPACRRHTARHLTLWDGEQEAFRNLAARAEIAHGKGDAFVEGLLNRRHLGLDGYWFTLNP